MIFRLNLLFMLLFIMMKSEAQTIVAASPKSTIAGSYLQLTIKLSAAVSSPAFTLVGKSTMGAWSTYQISPTQYQVGFNVWDNVPPGNYQLRLNNIPFDTAIGITRRFPQLFAYQPAPALTMNLGGYSIYGDPYFQIRAFEGVKGIAEDSKGNIYYSGIFSGTVNFGLGPVTASGYRDGFVAKYNPAGALIWVKTIGGNSTYAPTYDYERFEGLGTIKIYNDTAIYICGLLFTDATLKYNKTTTMVVPARSVGAQDGVLLKLDTSGALKWYAFQGAKKDDMTEDLDIDKKGNLYITGYLRGDVDYNQYNNLICATYVYSAGLKDTISLEAYSNDNQGFFVAKYSPAGKVIWAKRQTRDFLSSGGVGMGISVASENQINVIATASNVIMYDSVSCSNGGYGNNKYYILQIDSTGKRLWCDGGGNHGMVHNVSNDKYGNVYFIYSYSAGSDELRLVKYSPAGTKVWDRIISPNAYVFGAHASITDSTGNTYVAYAQYYLSSSSRALILKKFDPAGNDLAITFPDTSTPATHNNTSLLAFGKDQSSLFFAGGYSGTQTFGATTFSSTTPRAFVVRLSSQKSSVLVHSVNDLCKSSISKVVYSNSSYPDTLQFHISKDSFTNSILLNNRVVQRTGLDTLLSTLPLTATNGNYRVRIISSAFHDTTYSNYFHVYDKPKQTGFTVSSSIGCINNNRFVFTDTSQFDSSFYKRKWAINNVKVDSASTLVKTFTTTGAYQVKMILSDQLGCADSTTQTINVYPKPKALLSAQNNTPICPGDSVVLQMKDSAGYTYKWFRDNLLLPDTTYTLPAKVGGSYKAFVKDQNGCSDTSATMMITLHQLPIVNVNKKFASVCDGDSVWVMVNDSPRYTIHWFRDNQLLPNNDYTWWIKKRGVYQVIVTDTHGCSNPSSPIVIIVNDKPAKPVIQLIGADTLRSSLTAHAYTWYLNHIPLVTQTVSYLRVNQPGSYTLGISSDSGCTSVLSDSFSYSPVNGLNNIAHRALGITLYPNPAADRFTVDVHENRPFSITLLDIQGKQVFKSTGSEGVAEIQIPRDIQPGLYFIEINISDGTPFYHKLRIQAH